MNKKLLAIFIVVTMLVLAVAVTCALITGYKAYRPLKFEYLQTVTTSNPEEFRQETKNLKWFTIRDQKYNGFFNEGMFDTLHVLVNTKDFDYSKYTYVVTVGHELEELSYSYSCMKNRNMFLLPKQFVGKAVLNLETTDQIYIYRTKKIDLDCDYHERDKNVLYRQ